MIERTHNCVTKRKPRAKLLGAAIIAALLVGSTAARANLITNGGFETGDLTGFTVTADTTGVAPSGFDGMSAHSGNYFLALADTSTTYPYGIVSVSAPIVDTAGATLSLSYWFATDGGTPNYFEALWNGAVIAGSIVANAQAMAYTEYQFNVTATGADMLSFHEQNVPSFSALDDISLVATAGTGGSPPAGVPEPASLALLGLALAGVASTCRSRKYTSRS